MNEHLPTWITLGAQVRYRGEGTEEGSPYLLERYRVSLGIQPLPWMGFFGEFQDARAVNLPVQGAGIRDEADIRQAYVRIGQEGGWWDVKAGRQKMAFGSERVIGAGEWGNTARVFDAVRLGIHHKNDRVDIFSSSVVVNNSKDLDHHMDGDNLHGVYGSFSSWLKGSKIEPYLLLRANHRFADSTNWTYGRRDRSGAMKRRRWASGANCGDRSCALGRGGAGAEALSVRPAGTDPDGRGQLRFRRPSAGRRGDQYVGSALPDQPWHLRHCRPSLATQHEEHPRRCLGASGEVVDAEGRIPLLLAGQFPRWALCGQRGVDCRADSWGALSSAVGPEADVLADVKLSRFYDIGAQYGHLFRDSF